MNTKTLASVIASTIELDLNDKDFSNAEKSEAINSAACEVCRKLHALDDNVLIEQIISELATRYNVLL